MSNITYTRKGSATTKKIAEAPVAIQKVWEKATGLGVNVLRVRVAQKRHEITRGNTFDGFHEGKVSIYKQRKNPIDALWFRRFVKLNESNKGMQVLEVADNMDVQNTLEVIDTFNKYENGGIIVRILRAIRSVFA